MEPTNRVIDQPWLTDDGASAVMAALETHGGQARFVGGCVRDALLDRPIRDIDIATDLPPEAAMAVLEAAGIKVIPTGLQHGTVTAVVDGHPFEVTTLRVDVETDGRRAKVAFTDNWAEDAQRRDFTFNALYCDVDGRVYDPVGGLEDLAAGRVRFIGDPEMRIIEDELRILRFFRFHAWYGAGDIDSEGLAACRAHIGDLGGLSAERVQSEMLRLLGAPSPVSTLESMAESGLLAAVLPEAETFDRLARLVDIETRLGEPDSVRRLAALLSAGDVSAAQGLAARWKLSNRARDRLNWLAAQAEPVPVELTPSAAHQMIYWGGLERFQDTILLSWASDGVDRLEILGEQDWPVPGFPLSGKDVAALGVDAGPRMGELLSDVEAWWSHRDFKDARAALLEHLAKLVAIP